MALDLELKIVADLTLDVSAAATQTSGVFGDAASEEFNKAGLPEGATFVVHSKAAGACDAGDAQPVELELQISVDAGSNFYGVAKVAFDNNPAVGLRAARIGLLDLVPEARAETDLQCRVVATWTQDADETDNPIIDAYIAGPQGLRAFE